MFHSKENIPANNHQIEAIKLQLDQPDKNICYQVLLDDNKWSDVFQNGETAGTTGQGKPIRGVSIWLTNAKEYSLCYKIFNTELGWSQFGRNGEKICMNGSKIYALDIKITKGTPIKTQ